MARWMTTYVTIDGGTPHADPALIGEVRDLTQFTKVVEFNDIPALEKALAAERRRLRAGGAHHDQCGHGAAG
jgi:glutamate-1-semialdehyde aminotransferase